MRHRFGDTGSSPIWLGGKTKKATRPSRMRQRMAQMPRLWSVAKGPTSNEALSTKSWTSSARSAHARFDRSPC